MRRLVGYGLVGKQYRGAEPVKALADDIDGVGAIWHDRVRVTISNDCSIALVAIVGKPAMLYERTTAPDLTLK